MNVTPDPKPESDPGGLDIASGAQVSESQRVERLVAEFVEQLRNGCAPDSDDLILANPTIAHELEPRLKAAEALHGSISDSPLQRLVNAPAKIGRFEVREILGHGSSAIVYRAIDPRLGREVALKVISFGVPSGSKILERFARDARTMSELRHQNIVPVYETGEANNCGYIAMELVPGESLESLFERLEPIPYANIASILQRVAEALHHAHQSGIVHRDVKPSNILLGNKGEPQLTDFGLCRHVDADVKLTASGELLGTPAYMSPEQTQGKSADIGPASDIYSLGVVMYRMLTGQLPFAAEQLPLLLRQIAEEEVPSPHTMRPDLPRDLETICLKALEKRPEERFASAEAFAEELWRWRHGEPLKIGRRTLRERLRRWSRRNRLATRAIGSVIVLFIVATAIGAVAWLEHARARLAEGEADLAREGQAIEADAHARVQFASLLDAARERLRTPTIGRQREAQALLRQTAPYRPLIRSSETVADLDLEVRSIYAATLSLPEVIGGARLELPNNPIRHWSLSFHPNGQFAAIGTNDRPVIWRANQAPVFDPEPEAPTPFTLVSYSPDEKHLIFVPANGGLQVWDADASHLEKTLLDAQDKRPLAFGFDPNGHELCCFCVDGSIRSWSLPDFTTPHTSPMNQGRASAWSAARFAPDGAHVAAGDRVGNVCIFDSHGQLLRRLTNPPSGDEVQSFAWSRDGQMIAVGFKGGDVELWRSDGAHLKEFVGLSTRVDNIEFTPDGLWLLAGAGNDGTKVWDLASTELVSTMPGQVAAIAPGTGQIASLLGQGIQIWELRSPAELRVLRGNHVPIEILVWSGNGRRLAILDSRFRVRIWDLAIGQVIDQFHAPSGKFFAHNAAIALNHDGTLLGYASGGEEKSTAFIRDVAAHRPIQEWTLPAGFETMIPSGQDRFLLVREEFEPAKQTVQSVVRYLQPGRNPSPARIIRYSEANDTRRYLTSELTADGRFYYWLGPRLPISSRRVEVREVATGRALAVIPVSRAADGSEPTVSFDTAGRVVTVVSGPIRQRYDLSANVRSEPVLAPFECLSADGRWRVYSPVPERGPYRFGWSISERLSKQIFVNLSGYDRSIGGMKPVFSPDGRFLAWGSTAGHVYVTELDALKSKIDEFERSLRAD